MVKSYRVETPKAVFLVDVEDGVVQDAADYAARWNGKSWDDFVRVWGKHGAKITEIPEAIP